MKKLKGVRLHPALVFLILTISVMIISSVGSLFHLESTYYVVENGSLASRTVTISNLFNRTGLQILIGSLMSNFTNFSPLVNIIVGLLGVGVAYKSGFLVSFYKMITKNKPRKLFTFIVILLGIISGLFYESGYVILLPLAAILFITLGRHPGAGITAAFAGLTFGYGANIVINNLDSILTTYSKTATSILDASYKIHMDGNLYLMIASSLLISYIGMIITEKLTVKKLGKYKFTEEENYIVLEEPTNREKKGVILSLLVTLLISLIIIYCILPGLPFSGLLLYLKEKVYVDQLFGDNSYFKLGSTFIFSFLLIVLGLVYGFRTKTFKNNWDVVDGMNYYLKDMSSIIILIFFTAQFIMIFKQTNIGVFIVSSLSEVLGNLELSGISLIIVSFSIVLISSLFVPSFSTKWAIFAPIMVPMFMQNSFTAEYAEAVFRGAASSVMGITPLFNYFVILIGFLQIYTSRKEDTITITETMSLMTPYTLIYIVLWMVIVLSFYILGVPLGPNTSVMI